MLTAVVVVVFVAHREEHFGKMITDYDPCKFSKVMFIKT